MGCNCKRNKKKFQEEIRAKRKVIKEKRAKIPVEELPPREKRAFIRAERVEKRKKREKRIDERNRRIARRNARNSPKD